MTWHWLAFDCTAFDWPFVCAEDIQCLLWIYMIFIRRFLCMFSIFNALVKHFLGFLSQAVLLNLLREILSKTQNVGSYQFWRNPHKLYFMSPTTHPSLSTIPDISSQWEVWKDHFVATKRGESLIWTNLDIHSLKSLIQTKQKWIGMLVLN